MVEDLEKLAKKHKIAGYVACVSAALTIGSTVYLKHVFKETGRPEIINRAEEYGNRKNICDKLQDARKLINVPNTNNLPDETRDLIESTFPAEYKKAKTIETAISKAEGDLRKFESSSGIIEYNKSVENKLQLGLLGTMIGFMGACIGVAYRFVIKSERDIRK